MGVVMGDAAMGGAPRLGQSELNQVAGDVLSAMRGLDIDI